MKTINYNFTSFDNVMNEFKQNPNSQNLSQIKRELNKFFKDSTCRDIIYTRNTDKPFFGMCVIPYITGDLAVKILGDDEKTRINMYYIEIDSKLLDIDFTERELIAILLHEVGHLVNDAIPVDVIRGNIDKYLVDNDDNLIITKSVQYRDILAFGIKQGLSNITSLFKKDDEEIIADQFSVLCGYGPDLESAFRKLTNNTTSLNRGVPKLIALKWTLQLYKDVKIRRIQALHTINKAKYSTASIFQKRELDNLARRLNQIDDHDLISETNVIVKKVSNLYKNFKLKGMRSLEDDLYEINLRSKNCDEEEEALALLRMINTRMSIIDDYIHTEEVNENERDRWDNLFSKYNLIRNELSKKTVYDNKVYGLFVKQPIVKSRCEV